MKELQLSALVDTMDYLDTDTCLLADFAETATELVEEEVEEEVGEVEEEVGCTGECEVEVGGGLVGRILGLLAGRR